MRNRLATAAVSMAGCAAIVGVGLLVLHATPPLPSSASHLSSHRCSSAGNERRVVGVALNPPLVAGAQSFAKAAGERMSVVEFYDAFGRPFQSAEADQVASLDALPAVQINPRHASLSQIAAGGYDRYLRKYATSVRAFGCKIILSFGHEMNGSWYPWGCHHVTGKVFIAAWRHIVDVVTAAGAHNVIWMWTANTEVKGGCSLASAFPGNRYVTWIGIDGYLRRPGTTFHKVFDPSLKQVRRLSQKPILLSETGVLVKTAQAPGRIGDLYSGASKAHGVIGIVYFDGVTGKFGDYRPQDSAAASAALRQAVRTYIH